MPFSEVDTGTGSSFVAESLVELDSRYVVLPIVADSTPVVTCRFLPVVSSETGVSFWLCRGACDANS